MSEAGFSLRVHPRTLAVGLKMIAGFREVSDTPKITENQIRDILSDSIGPEFVARLTASLSSQAELERLSEYLPHHADMEWLFSAARIYGKNPDILWIESRSGQLEAWELCPDYITLHTRSEDYGEYHSYIDLIYGFTEIGPVKAAVFASAFVAAKFEIDDVSNWDDHEEDA